MFNHEEILSERKKSPEFVLDKHESMLNNFDLEINYRMDISDYEINSNIHRIYEEWMSRKRTKVLNFYF